MSRGDQGRAGSTIDTPAVTKLEDQHFAKLHLTVAKNEIQKVMGPGLQEVNEAITAQGARPAGPWFTHHLRMDPKVWDFEICVPVKKPVAAAGRVTPGRMPAGQRAARATHRGGYEGLGAAWGELLGWVESEGLDPADDMWEIYTVGPETNPDPGAWRTELIKPLK